MVAVAWPAFVFAHVADRRAKRSRLIRYVGVAGEAFYGDLNLDLPTWLCEVMPDTNDVYKLAWWLGRCHFGDVDCDFPATEAEMAVLPPLLDVSAERVRVTICSQPPSDGDQPRLPSILPPSARCENCVISRLSGRTTR